MMLMNKHMSDEDAIARFLVGDKESEKLDKKFRRSHIKRLKVPEVKTLLTLAYEGPLNKYQIKRIHKCSYPLVHRAVKSLEELEWIEVVDKPLSKKNVPTKVYSLTREGLLWLFSRIPKEIPPWIFEDNKTSEEEHVKERKALRLKAEDISKVEDLSTQDDVYFHLLFEFNVDLIAKNNKSLFPLIFNNWDYYKSIGVAEYISWEFPEIAFRTLIEYYYGYEGLRDQLGSLEMLFTYKVYEAFLKKATEYFATLSESFKPNHKMIENTTEQVIALFTSNPQLKELFQQISKKIETEHKHQLTFIKKVKSKMSQAVSR